MTEFKTGETPRNGPNTAGEGGARTWSCWLVCLMRNLRKLNREHFRMRMRSKEPSPKWAAGERPPGHRGQAQHMFMALTARNFPPTTFHSSISSRAGGSIADRTSGAGGRGRERGQGSVRAPPWCGRAFSPDADAVPPLSSMQGTSTVEMGPTAVPRVPPPRKAELWHVSSLPRGLLDSDSEQGSPSLARQGVCGL